MLLQRRETRECAIQAHDRRPGRVESFGGRRRADEVGGKIYFFSPRPRTQDLWADFKSPGIPPKYDFVDVQFHHLRVMQNIALYGNPFKGLAKSWDAPWSDWNLAAVASKAASRRVGDYYSFPGEGWIYVCRMRFVFSLRRMAYGVKCHVVNGSKHWICHS